MAKPSEQPSLDSLIVVVKSNLYSNPDSAIKLSKKIVQASILKNDKRMEMQAYRFIVIGYDVEAKTDSAFYYLPLHRNLAIELQDTLHIGLNHLLKGILNFEMEDYDDAIFSFQDALPLFKAVGDKKRESADLNNMASVYKTLDQPQKAIELFEKSLHIAIDEKDKRSEAIAYDNLATLYSDQKEYDKSLNYNNKAYLIFDSLKQSWNVAKTYFNAGIVYFAENDSEKALENFKKSHELFTKLNDQSGMGGSGALLSKEYLKINNLPKALYWNDKAWENLKNTVTISDIINLFKTRAEILQKKGDLKGANEALLTALSYRDSSQTSQDKNTLRLINMRTRAEGYKKSLSNLMDINQSVEQEKDLQGNFLIATILFSAILVIILIVLIKQYRKNRFLLREVAKKNEVIDLQLNELEKANESKDLLFSIIAHDLKSPIASLHSTLQLVNEGQLNVEEGKYLFEQISADLQENSKLLDNMFYWARSQMNGIQTKPEVLPLLRELNETITIYGSLAKTKNITLEEDVSDTISVWADEDQLKLIMRNLVHNAIKNTPAEGIVNISAYPENLEKTLIKITDTGSGMSDAQLKKLKSGKPLKTTRGTQGEAGTGLGLMLVMDFVKRNNGKIEFKSEPGKGTTILLTFYNSDPSKSVFKKIKEYKVYN